MSLVRAGNLVCEPFAAVFVAAAALLGLALSACGEYELPGSDPTQVAAASTAPSEVDVAALEQDVTAGINAQREAHGMVALTSREDLAAVARAYSCRMAEESFFDHVSPDGLAVDDRVKGAGITYRQVGENLAFHTGAEPLPQKMVSGWMDSDSHRENILHADFTETGVGACAGGGRWYYTQLFLLPR